MICNHSHIDQLIHDEYICTPDNTVFFWSNGDIHADKLHKGCLSQWWPCIFSDYKHRYNSAEQYMMVQKAELFSNYALIPELIKQNNPSTIKQMGRKVSNFIPSDWDQFKFDIVVAGNLLKFSQNKKLQEYLLSTGDKLLVEASPYDRVWGIGLNPDDENKSKPNNWRGNNLLGFALMEVRNQLRRPIEKYPNIQTGYYAGMREYQELQCISISLGVPKWLPVPIPNCRPLNPTAEILALKEDHPAYTKAFEKYLANLNINEILTSLVQLSNGRDLILLCYEKPGDFCHRHIVATWIERLSGIHVSEFRTKAMQVRKQQDIN